MYEEFQKHFNKCIELKEDPIEKRYILECLKFKMDEAKKLVINRHPYIRWKLQMGRIYGINVARFLL